MKSHMSREPSDAFELPVFEKAQVPPRSKSLSWEQVMEETEAVRGYYLEHYDTPEKRLREKNSEPFRME